MTYMEKGKKLTLLHPPLSPLAVKFCFSRQNQHFAFIEPENIIEIEKDCALPRLTHVFLPLALL